MKPGGSIVKVKEGNRARGGEGEEKGSRNDTRTEAGCERKGKTWDRSSSRSSSTSSVNNHREGDTIFPSSTFLDRAPSSFSRFLFSGHFDFHSDFHTQQSFIRKCPFNVPLPCPWPVASAARVLLLLEPLLPPLCPRKRISPFSISIGVVLSCKLSICCR